MASEEHDASLYAPDYDGLTDKDRDKHLAVEEAAHAVGKKYFFDEREIKVGHRMLRSLSETDQALTTTDQPFEKRHQLVDDEGERTTLDGESVLVIPINSDTLTIADKPYRTAARELATTPERSTP